MPSNKRAETESLSSQIEYYRKRIEELEAAKKRAKKLKQKEFDGVQRPREEDNDGNDRQRKKARINDLELDLSKLKYALLVQKNGIYKNQKDKTIDEKEADLRIKLAETKFEIDTAKTRLKYLKNGVNEDGSNEEELAERIRLQTLEHEIVSNNLMMLDLERRMGLGENTEEIPEPEPEPVVPTPEPKKKYTGDSVLDQGPAWILSYFNGKNNKKETKEFSTKPEEMTIKAFLEGKDASDISLKNSSNGEVVDLSHLVEKKTEVITVDSDSDTDSVTSDTDSSMSEAADAMIGLYDVSSDTSGSDSDSDSDSDTKVDKNTKYVIYAAYVKNDKKRLEEFEPSYETQKEAAEALEDVLADKSLYKGARGLLIRKETKLKGLGKGGKIEKTIVKKVKVEEEEEEEKEKQPKKKDKQPEKKDKKDKQPEKKDEDKMDETPDEVLTSKDNASGPKTNNRYIIGISLDDPRTINYKAYKDLYDNIKEARKAAKGIISRGGLPKNSIFLHIKRVVLKNGGLDFKFSKTPAEELEIPDKKKGEKKEKKEEKKEEKKDDKKAEKKSEEFILTVTKFVKKENKIKQTGGTFKSEQEAVDALKKAQLDKNLVTGKIDDSTGKRLYSIRYKITSYMEKANDNLSLYNRDEAFKQARMSFERDEVRIVHVLISVERAENGMINLEMERSIFNVALEDKLYVLQYTTEKDDNKTNTYKKYKSVDDAIIAADKLALEDKITDIKVLDYMELLSLPIYKASRTKRKNWYTCVSVDGVWAAPKAASDFGTSFKDFGDMARSTSYLKQFDKKFSKVLLMFDDYSKKNILLYGRVAKKYMESAKELPPFSLDVKVDESETKRKNPVKDEDIPSFISEGKLSAEKARKWFANGGVIKKKLEYAYLTNNIASEIVALVDNRTELEGMPIESGPEVFKLLDATKKTLYMSFDNKSGDLKSLENKSLVALTTDPKSRSDIVTEQVVKKITFKKSAKFLLLDYKSSATEKTTRIIQSVGQSARDEMRGIVLKKLEREEKPGVFKYEPINYYGTLNITQLFNAWGKALDKEGAWNSTKNKKRMFQGDVIGVAISIANKRNKEEHDLILVVEPGIDYSQLFEVGESVTSFGNGIDLSTLRENSQ